MIKKTQAINTRVLMAATAVSILSTPTLANATDVNDMLEREIQDGYLVLESNQGAYELKFDGRIMLDMGAVSTNANETFSNTNMRRVRLGIKTKMYNTWAGEFDVDFAENEVDIKDMWVAYYGIPGISIKIGNHKPFFSMAELTTSRWYTFTETPTPTEVFFTGRRVGLSISGAQPDYFWGATIFGDEINTDPNDEDEEGQSEHFGYTARGSYLPYHDANYQRLVHLGANYMLQKPQSLDENRLRLRNGPRTSLVDINFINTGKMRNVNDMSTYSLEFAAKYDRWMMQSEYLKNTVTFTDDRNDYEGDGYYIETSYMLFGGERPYDYTSGEFAQVMAKGTTGFWELAIRYDELDLNDTNADILAGSQNTTTVGVNWYANTNMVFRLNYTKTKYDQYATDNGSREGNEDLSAVTLRVQYMF